MSGTAESLVQRMLAREFEFNLSLLQLFYYTAERRLCHILLRRAPPKRHPQNFLNLGCGPHSYNGWINADDYAPKRRFREPNFKPDWTLDITRPWCCPDDYWDGIFTEHVIEHITYAQAAATLKECLRTLRPRAWIRISVPDLGRYIAYYRGELDDSAFYSFPRRALALSFLTQMHLHKSVWDADLMVALLRDIGFVDVAAVPAGKGTDARLIRDDPDKVLESLYVEACKPG